MSFCSIEEAIAEIRQGKMIVLVDDEDRENEGDLVMAAEKVSAEAINFMATYGRGLICAPLTGERIEQLQLNLMVLQNTDPNGTAFTVSVDAANCSTGISAYERAATVKILVDPQKGPAD